MTRQWLFGPKSLIHFKFRWDDESSISMWGESKGDALSYLNSTYAEPDFIDILLF